MDLWTLVHRNRSQATGADDLLQGREAPARGLCWQTCLREIYIGPSQEGKAASANGDLVLQGQKAYQFLLEVLCGLHSPLVGETEVFGQFKQFYSQIHWETYPHLRFFKEVALRLLIDTKKVRTKHLERLGSQSYGSLARRWLENESLVHILGGGRLVQDILPWLTKSKVQICLYVRSPEKVEQADWFKVYADQVQVFSLEQAPKAGGAVLVASPLSSSVIEGWMRAIAVSRILDLRGESRTDALSSQWRVVNLDEALARIESNRQKVEQVKALALHEVQLLAEEFYQTQKVRPFGWDDLCA